MKPFRPDNVDSLPGVLIRNWIDAVAEEKAADSALNRARTATANAVYDLAKSVAPPDVQEGEKLLLPHDGGFIQIEYGFNDAAIITIREKKP